MKYGARYLNSRQPTMAEILRARDVRYICLLDGNQYDLVDEGTDQEGAFAHCPKCQRLLRPREKP